MDVQNKPAKNRFNIIDLILIVAVLAIVASVVLRSGLTKKLITKSENGEIEYEFIINSLRDTSDSYFAVGEKFYSQSTHEEVGEILEVTTRPAEAYIELPNGEIVKTYIPNRIDVIGKAKVMGNVDADGRCMMGGTTHIAAGKNIYARTLNVSFMFTVEGVNYISTTKK